MNSNTLHNFKWTPESVTEFWSMLAETPLNTLSFSKMSLPHLLKFVQNVAEPGARILDFGGGGGELAAELMRHGYKVGVYEPAEGRHDPNLTGHENWLGYFDRSATEQFDVVCALEVLEHFLPETFKEDMARLAAFCVEQGKVIGTVPYEENLAQNMCLCPECGSLFHKWQHQRSFTQESLKAALCEAGLPYCHTFVTEYTISMGFVAGFEDFAPYDVRIPESKDLHTALSLAIYRRWQLKEVYNGLLGEHTALQSEYARMQGEHTALQSEYARLQGEHTALRSEQARLQGEHTALQSEQARLQGEHTALQSEYIGLQGAQAALQSEYAELQEENTALQSECARMQREHAALRSEHAELQDAQAALQNEYARIQGAHAALQSEQVGLQGEHAALRSEHGTLQERLVALERVQADRRKLAEDVGGEHNVETIRKHTFSAKVLGYVWRRLERITSF